MVLNRTNWLVALAMLAATGAMTCRADIVANFDAGDTSSAVDGNPGRAGNGWSNAWGTNATATNGSLAKATVTMSVQSTAPLMPGGGSYLAVNVATDSVARTITLAQGDISRSWVSGAGGVDTTGTTRIEFYFRPRTVDGSTRYVIFDNATGVTGTDSGCTFQIAANASGWLFYDGQGNNVTTQISGNGKALAEGHAYYLTIDVTSAGKWRGSVTDLDAPANGTFTTNWIGFRTSNKALYGNLYFGAADQTPGSASSFDFDIDGIKITAVPEVTSLGIFGFASVLLAGKRP